jgi:hypothetical protein
VGRGRGVCQADGGQGAHIRFLLVYR